MWTFPDRLFLSIQSFSSILSHSKSLYPDNHLLIVSIIIMWYQLFMMENFSSFDSCSFFSFDSGGIQTLSTFSVLKASFIRGINDDYTYSILSIVVIFVLRRILDEYKKDDNISVKL